MYFKIYIYFFIYLFCPWRKYVDTHSYVLKSVAIPTRSEKKIVEGFKIIMMALDLL